MKRCHLAAIVLIYRKRFAPGRPYLAAACIAGAAVTSPLHSARADPPPAKESGSSQPAAPSPTATGDWGGARTNLANAGIALGGSWIMEGFDDLAGGAQRGSVGASTLDANVTVDLQKLTALDGAEIYLDLEDHAGRNPDDLVGDLEGTDKHNWTPYLQLFEAWYQQKLFGNTLRIKIGKIDANTEFSVINNGLDFLAPTTQVTPTLLGFTTTPDPMPAIDVFWTPTPLFYAAASLADANRADHFLDFSGHPSANEPTEDGKLLIGETGLTWKHLAAWQTDGNLRLGLWDHTGRFTRLDGGTQRDAAGGYAILDQTLWHPGASADEPRGLRGFLEYAHTDGRISPITTQLGAGLDWTGPFAIRAQDAIGVTAQNERLSTGAEWRYRTEMLMEGFYKAQLTPWAFVQPDLQYIRHPGGRYRDAVQGILSMQITL